MLIIKNPEDTLVYTAGTYPIEIECDVIKQFTSPLFGGVQWYKDGKTISSAIDQRVTIKMRNMNSDVHYAIFDFTLVNTTVNDTGVYSCALSAPLSESDSIKVIIKGKSLNNSL